MKLSLRSALALALCTGGFGCSVAESTSDTPDPEAQIAALSVEDVSQYADCPDNGHSLDTLDLGNLNAAVDPTIRATFTTASCIVGKLTLFEGKFRPYNLQSYKKLDGEYRFFFKRVSTNIIGEKASECLKVKMTATVSPTDTFVTITRVKQLPPPRADGLCADNGEV